MRGVEARLNELHSGLDTSYSENVKKLSAAVRQQMEGIEVVYLPTYRRIETPLLRPKRSKGLAGRINDGESQSHGDMAFGLTDVQERLVELSEDIERRSNIEYRALSAQIIKELLKGRAQAESVELSDLPDTDSLHRFLSRVDPRGTQLGDLIEDVSNLFTPSAAGTEGNWFVKYFLSRLKRVIDKTREIELRVERFVNVCNSYLAGSSDKKQLTFDPQTLQVVVKDTWADRTISLDDLSSGEKQIISLMARLYLSDKPKMVLVDEPELSLSLNWQRKVLPDVMKSGSVVQLLAITHSPFVFENELDDFTRHLKISVN